MVLTKIPTRGQYRLYGDSLGSEYFSLSNCGHFGWDNSLFLVGMWWGGRGCCPVHGRISSSVWVSAKCR